MSDQQIKDKKISNLLIPLESTEEELSNNNSQVNPLLEGKYKSIEDTTEDINANIEVNSICSEEELVLPKYKTAKSLRWLIVILCCFVVFGIEFSVGSIIVIKKHLKAYLCLSDLSYNMLISIGSFPNIILPMFAGLMIDKIGVRIGLIIFSSLVVLGQLIFVLSIQWEVVYAIALPSRFIFGVGSESLTLTIYTYIVTSFGGLQGLALPLAIAKAGGRIADLINDNLTPAIYTQTHDVRIPLWVAWGTCLFSMSIAVLLLVIDLYKGRHKGKTLPIRGNVKWRDLRYLGVAYWIFVVACFFIHSLANPFFTELNEQAADNFGASDTQVGYLFSIPDAIAIVLPPLLGIGVDKIGKRTLLFIGVSVIFITYQIYFALLPPNNLFALALIGVILFSLGFAAFWTIILPIIPLLVEGRIIGTGYGILYCFNNLGSTIGPIIVGAIKDHTYLHNGFFWGNVFLALMATIGLVLATILYIYDRKHTNILNK